MIRKTVCVYHWFVYSVRENVLFSAYKTQSIAIQNYQWLKVNDLQHVFKNDD